MRSHHRRAAARRSRRRCGTPRGVRLSTRARSGAWCAGGSRTRRADITYHELFQRYPFTLLEEGDTWSLSGLCGKIWTLQRDYPRLAGPDDYEAWDEPGHASACCSRTGRGRRRRRRGARLATPGWSRSAARATLRVRSLWAVIGTFERLIGAEPLVFAQRRAEGLDARARARRAPTRRDRRSRRPRRTVSARRPARCWRSAVRAPLGRDRDREHVHVAAVGLGLDLDGVHRSARADAPAVAARSP